jgi:hypothetical protein
MFMVGGEFRQLAKSHATIRNWQRSPVTRRNGQHQLDRRKSNEPSNSSGQLRVRDPSGAGVTDAPATASIGVLQSVHDRQGMRRHVHRKGPDLPCRSWMCLRRPGRGDLVDRALDQLHARPGIHANRTEQHD